MTDMPATLARIAATVRATPAHPVLGRVVAVRDPVVQVALTGVPIGSVGHVVRPGLPDLPAQVIAVDGDIARMCLFGAAEGITLGAIVRPVPGGMTVPVGPGLCGRVIDPFGAPIDEMGPVAGTLTWRRIVARPPGAMTRPMINRPLVTGLRATDGPLTLGHGQRVCILGAPGSGKTTLLSTLARQAQTDVIVIGLVGERGREVREFIDRDLPRHSRDRVVMVAATSDRPAAERALCAQTATCVAEYFRDQGKSVLLMIDSLTRTARALREIGLAAGEPPTRRGYPASVYPALPAIIERAGRSPDGDITAIHTVLTEGAAETDPIADEVKSLTDGHIQLSPALAEAGHFPAIDLLASLSRCAAALTVPTHAQSARALRAHLARYRDIELLVQVGEYRPGTDPQTDRAIAARPAILRFLAQAPAEQTEFHTTQRLLQEVVR